ncbi:hypothetical protein Tco_0542619 [Tanacetum coccineum]
METKDTISSCSNSKAQQMQQIQDKAKESLHDSDIRQRIRLIRAKQWEASLVNTREALGTEQRSQIQARSGNDTHADDADIRPIYDEEPMAEVQTTAEINILLLTNNILSEPEFNNEGKG